MNMLTILSDYLQLLGCFELYFRKTENLLGKSKNVLNKFPTEYNLLPKCHLCQDHPGTSSIQNSVHR